MLDNHSTSNIYPGHDVEYLINDNKKPNNILMFHNSIRECYTV